MNTSFIKMEAKNCVKGHRFTLLKPYLLIWIISYAISVLFSFLAIGDIGIDTLANMDYESAISMVSSSKLMTISSIVSLLITSPLQYGLIRFYNVFESGNMPTLGIVFEPIRHIVKIFVMTVFINIMASIGFAFLVIPGIIICCAFSIVPFVYCKHLDVGIMEMLSHAWRMMRGHKMEYVFLELSFIGWYLVGLLTFGIGFLWVLPYREMTLVKYFNQLEETYVA